MVSILSRWLVCILVLLPGMARGASKKAATDLWVLKPLGVPPIPATDTSSDNPIDAFITQAYREKGLRPVGLADKRALLRRVYLDLVGLPPTPAEQDAFLADASADAYEKVVDHLLASEQHGVRYARHWLDVLRYADADEQMTAAPGIYLWRDWVINALNEDLPYDQFVRAQLTGYRSNVRTKMSATGYRSRAEPRPDDMFALGFLARGQVIRDGKDNQELAITAVDTISTAFMGLTVGCAKCHDHMFDPISQRDYYSMKALFDPLVLKKVQLAGPADLVAAGKAQTESDKRREAVEAPLEELIAPYRKRLYDQRVAMLPDDVRAIVLTPEKDRSAAQQKIADDYFPVLRIDSDKINEIMPEADRRKYSDLQRQLNAVARRGPAIPVFYTVEVDPRKELAKSYILTSADPDRPEKSHEVQPGWPFAPANIDFRDGRIEAFSDWLTAPLNPMFARVAANRIWQWHFGEGLEKSASDFGSLGGKPSNPQLLDWLADQFVKGGFSMKKLHRLIVTSDAYKRSSEVDPAMARANDAIDPANAYRWHYRLERLEAEPIWDSILSAAGTLDSTVGGPSFDVSPAVGRRGGGGRFAASTSSSATRRAAYMIRGYSTSRDVVPSFLQAFDVDDGRTPCPMRTQTVTAPQALFAMNSDEIDRASARFAQRLQKEAPNDLRAQVDLAYHYAVARSPSTSEMNRALGYLDNDPSHLKGFTWIMFNLDEFIYAR